MKWRVLFTICYSTCDVCFTYGSNLVSSASRVSNSDLKFWDFSMKRYSGYLKIYLYSNVTQIYLVSWWESKGDLGYFLMIQYLNVCFLCSLWSQILRILWIFFTKSSRSSVHHRENANERVIFTKVTVPVCMFPMVTLVSSALMVSRNGLVILRFSKNAIQDLKITLIKMT